MPVGNSGGQIVELAVGSTGAISASSPLPVTLAQTFAGEDQTNNRLNTVIVDAAGNVNKVGVNSSGQLQVGYGPVELVAANNVTLPTGATGQFWNSATVATTGRNKIMWIVVNTALVFASGQPAIRLFASRTPVAASNGSTTALGLSASYLNAALTITSAAQTTIPVNTVYRIGPNLGSVSVGAAAQVVLGSTSGIAALSDPETNIGVEFNWGGSFTSGALSVYFECSG